MSMIGAVALLLACQLAGEALHVATGLPLPGSVTGMLLLIGTVSGIVMYVGINMIALAVAP